MCPDSPQSGNAHGAWAELGGAPVFAGLWIRFAALVMDGVLICAVFFPITRLVKGVWMMTPGDHRWSTGWFITDPLCIAFLMAMFAYFSVCEGMFGATFGKWVLRLRVRDVTGNRPGLVRGVARNLLRVVDGLPALCILGVVLILALPQRTRVGDLVAGTRVVRLPR